MAVGVAQVGRADFGAIAVDLAGLEGEFEGDGLASLSIDQRLTIANMTTEWGALAGVFPIDNVTFDWLEARARHAGHRAIGGFHNACSRNGLGNERAIGIDYALGVAW